MIDFFLSIVMAFQIGTGIGLNQIQSKVDKLEYKALQQKQFTNDDKKWLRIFYRTLAYGGQMVIILPEASRLLHHYLDATGETTSIEKNVLLSSPRFQKQLNILKNKLKNSCKQKKEYTSKRFDMGHGGFNDQAIALYYGTIKGKTTKKDDKHISIEWFVDMPWKWPNYDEIKKVKGRDKKETYPLPNALSFLGWGPHLWLDNELAGALEEIGLAKSFEVINKWEEKTKCK